MTPGRRSRRADEEKQEQEQEVDIEVCCDALYEAIEFGGVTVVETAPGVYSEVITSADGASGLIINYCPFCGDQRTELDEVAEDQRAAPQ
ncbi:MAG TPA: hypothetical protein VLH79_11920 [Chthonomonadales bacterium]|nr:hypothetical protein [Chthonomonadales bacterium]